MQEHQWSCRNCGCAYELATVEAQLLRAVRLRARAYQLQDLRCLKCRQVCLLYEQHTLTERCSRAPFFPGHFSAWPMLTSAGWQLGCARQNISLCCAWGQWSPRI